MPETDDIDELEALIQEMTASLMTMESKILEADMADELGEKARLQEEANKLRFKRENTVNKLKALKADGARSAIRSGVSMEFQEKINRNEEQIAALKTQVAMVRSDVYEMKDMLAEIMARLGIRRNDGYDRDD